MERFHKQRSRRRGRNAYTGAGHFWVDRVRTAGPYFSFQEDEGAIEEGFRRWQGVGFVGGYDGSNTWRPAAGLEDMKSKSKPGQWQFDLDGFARAIASKRSVDRMGMREVGKACGISAATVFRIETKRMPPDIRNVVLLCQWLGMTLDAFVVREKL